MKFFYVNFDLRLVIIQEKRDIYLSGLKSRLHWDKIDRKLATTSVD